MEDLLKVFLNDADLFSCLFCLLLTKALARFTASVFFFSPVTTSLNKHGKKKMSFSCFLDISQE